MSELSRRNKIILTVFVSITLAVMVVITIAAFFEDDTFIDRRIVGSLNIAVVLLLGLIQAVPALRDILHNQKVTDKEVTNALSELAQANAALKNGDTIKAKEASSRVIEILPKKAEAYRIRAEANFRLGQYISAIEDYTSAIEIEPGYPFVYSSRAYAYKEIGELHKSIDDWKMAIKIIPEVSGHLLFQLGETYFSIGEFSKAKEVFDFIIEHSGMTDKEKEMAQGFINRVNNLVS